MKRWFLDSDDDGHWYIIPCEKQKEWDKLLEDTNYCPENIPDYVEDIDGPHKLSFTDPKEDR